MLGNRKFAIDTMSEVYSLLKPWATDEFWDFSQAVPEPGTVYLFGRQQFVEHRVRIASMAETGLYTIVFCNAAEGSWTLQSQLQMLGIEQLILDHKILLISGGEQQLDYPYIQYDHFLAEILNYEENHYAMACTDEIFAQTAKPYKFLFLNGRARPHRKYLYERFRQLDILEQSLWTMLESRPCISRSFKLPSGDINLMATPSELRWLPREYEVEQYQNPTINPGPANRTLIKHELFNNTWGEIYLKLEPYRDTYFSLVTETVVEQPWPFRTEKIAKPLMIGHPFIVASSPGYYRDLHRLGFKTFGHLIDESFDSIDHHQDRMDRIITVVKDLCQQDLAQFQKECYTVCKYNQQHLQEIVPKLKTEFPEKFFKLISQHE
jgi:hypothetical protein